MRVVTISRLVGSGGAEIAGRVATALGFQLVTKRTVDEIFRQYGFPDFEHFYESPHGFWDRFDEVQQQSADLLGTVLRSLARRGSVVILGRASFAFLQDYRDVLNVRLWAPLAARVARVMERENLADRRQAEARVLENDHLRARFVHYCSQGRGDRPETFDVSINTGKVPLGAAVELIVEAARTERGAPREGSPTTLSIRGDTVMDGVIQKTLQEVMAGT